MLNMPEDWVVQDRSSNFSWCAQQHGRAGQCQAGNRLQKGVLCNGRSSDLGERALTAPSEVCAGN